MAGLDATGQDLAVPALLAVPELAPVGVAVAEVAGLQEQQHPSSRGSLDDAVAAGEVGLVRGAQVARHEEGCLPVAVARGVVRDERFDEVRHDGVEAPRGPVREVLVDLLEGGHAEERPCRVALHEEGSLIRIDQVAAPGRDVQREARQARHVSGPPRDRSGAARARGPRPPARAAGRTSVLRRHTCPPSGWHRWPDRTTWPGSVPPAGP